MGTFEDLLRAQGRPVRDDTADEEPIETASTHAPVTLDDLLRAQGLAPQQATAETPPVTVNVQAGPPSPPVTTQPSGPPPTSTEPNPPGYIDFDSDSVPAQGSPQVPPVTVGHAHAGPPTAMDRAQPPAYSSDAISGADPANMPSDAISGAASASTPQRPQDVSASGPGGSTPVNNGAPSDAPAPPPVLDPTSPDYVSKRTEQLMSAADPTTKGSGPGGAKTEEDLQYDQSALLDGGLRDGLKGLAQQQATDEAVAARRLPLQTEYDRADAALTQRRIDQLDRWTAMHRKYWDEQVRAQQAADAAYPNPDNLLGGKGSWARAIALALASSGAGVGDAGVTSLINSQMALQMGGMTANYDRLRRRAADAASNSDEATKTMEGEDAAVRGMQDAGKARLAEQFDLIAQQNAGTAIGAKFLSLSSALKQRVAEDKGKLATQMANADIKNQQMLMRGYHYDTKLHRWVGMDGSTSGGGGGGGGAGGPAAGDDAADAAFNALAPKDRERSVWNLNHTGFILEKDKETATTKQSLIDSANTATEAINEVQDTLRNNIPSFKEKLLGKMGWNSEDLAKIRGAMTLANAKIANAAAGGGKRTPLAEMKAVAKTLDDPTNFSAETMSALDAYRTGLQNEAISAFRSTHPGFIKPEHFEQAVADKPPPTTAEIGAQVVGLYPPTPSPSKGNPKPKPFFPDVKAVIGGDARTDDNGAIGQYVRRFYDMRGNPNDINNRRGEPDEVLAEELEDLAKKAALNVGLAINDKNVVAAQGYNLIVKQIQRMVNLVRSGEARKRWGKTIADGDVVTHPDDSRTVKGHMPAMGAK